MLVALLCLGTAARASTITWNSAGSGGAWLTGSNWSGSNVPGSGDTAQFTANPTASPYEVGINMSKATNNGTSNQIVGAIESLRTANPLFIGNSSTTTDGTLTLAGVTVNGVANVILRNGGSQLLTIEDAITNATQAMNVALGNATENNVSIDSTGGITISSIVSGSGRNLTLRGGGSGTFTLSGASANTFSGVTTVTSATLGLGKGTAGLNAFGGDLTISGGTVLYSSPINNQIPDAAKVTISSGSLIFGARSETIGLATASASGLALSGTGAITMSSGTIAIANSATITGGSITLSSSGTLNFNTDLAFSGGTIDLGSSTGATLGLRGGTLTGITYLATGTSGAIIKGSGTLSLNTGSNATTVFNVADSPTAATEMNIQVALTGAGKNILKTGAGVLALGGASTFTGSTTIDAGTLNVTTFGNVNNASGIGQGSSGGSAGDLVFGGGKLQYDTAAPATTNRLFTIGDANGNAASIDASAAAAANTLSFTGTGSIAFVNSAAHTLTLTGSNTGANTFAPVLGNQSATNVTNLVKSAGGTWLLSGANNYSGGTSITGGTLAAVNASGSATGSGAVSVGTATANSGTLGGTGTVAGAVTVNGGGTITGGSLGQPTGTVGTLKLTSALTVNGTYVADVAVATSTSDKLAINGQLTIGSGAKLTLNIVGSAMSAATYVLATYASLTDGTQFTLTNPLPNGYALVYKPTELDLTQVPEPGTWLGGALLVGSAAWARRWRAKRRPE